MTAMAAPRPIIYLAEEGFKGFITCQKDERPEKRIIKNFMVS
jgi:hypothetical protein